MEQSARSRRAAQGKGRSPAGQTGRRGTRRRRLGLAACAGLLLGATAAPVGADTLVVVNKSGESVSFLDPETGVSRGEFPSGPVPHEVAVSPDGSRALVTHYGSEERPGHSVQILDVAAGVALGEIDLAPHGRPHGVAWLADGRRAVVTTEAREALLLLDVDARRVLHAVPTGLETSHMVAVAPDGRRAWVAGIASGAVVAIDLDARRVVGRQATGEGAEGIAIAPDGRRLWAANREAGTVSVLDAASLEPQAELETGRMPIRVAFTPDGRRALVTSALSARVEVFDAEGLERVLRISTRNGFDRSRGRFLGGLFGLVPVPVGLLPVGPDRFWVSNTFAGEVALYEISEAATAEASPGATPGLEARRVRTLRAGREPDGLALSPLP